MRTYFSKNTWKYLSFTLMGILATGSVGLLIPQASAHITNNTGHMLQHIYNFVDTLEASVATLQTTANDIKAKTDAIPSDIASSADITDAKTELEGAMFSNIETGLILSTESNKDAMNCTSNADFLMHASVDPSGTALLDVKFEEEDGDTTGFAYQVSESGSLTLGQEAGRFLWVKAISGVGFDNVQAYVTAQSTEGSDLSCQIS